MNLFSIVFRNLRQHALSTAVTAGSVALAGGLLLTVWVVRDQSRSAFTTFNAGFDAVLGARGSQLQLVLNSLFHLESSPGNVAWLVALVASSSILASIYNSMNERRRELAILRALGARRTTVFTIIILEATTISGLGAITGFLIYGVLMTVVASIIRAQTGVVLEPWSFTPVMLWMPAVFLVLGALAGLVPALKAYRTDVASHLAPHS